MRGRQIAKASGVVALFLIGVGLEVSDENSLFSMFCFTGAALFALWFVYTWWKEPETFKNPSAEEIADAIRAKDSKDKNTLKGEAEILKNQLFALTKGTSIRVNDVLPDDPEELYDIVHNVQLVYEEEFFKRVAKFSDKIAATNLDNSKLEQLCKSPRSTNDILDIVLELESLSSKLGRPVD